MFPPTPTQAKIRDQLNDETVKHGSIQTLRPKDSPCTSEEWEQILESLLLGQEVVPDIHLTAAVGSGLQITVRKKVQRITASRPMPNFGTSAAHVIDRVFFVYNPSRTDLPLTMTSNASGSSTYQRMRARQLNCLTGVGLPSSPLITPGQSLLRPRRKQRSVNKLSVS